MHEYSFYGITFYSKVLLHGRPQSLVDEVEGEIGCRLPSYYREFVTQFGEVEFHPAPLIVDYVATIAPASREYPAWFDEYWFWTEDVLSRSAARESLRCFDDATADIILFLRDKPEVQYILSREDDSVEVASNFEELMNQSYSKMISSYRNEKLIFTPHSAHELRPEIPEESQVNDPEI